MTEWKHPSTFGGGRTVFVVFEYGERSLCDGILPNGAWSQAETGERFKDQPIAYAELPEIKLGADGKVDLEAMFASNEVDLRPAKTRVSKFVAALPTKGYVGALMAAYGPDADLDEVLDTLRADVDYLATGRG